MTPLKAGDIAPQFSLPDQDGELISLTDFQGQRVLVYFYPKAMTPDTVLLIMMQELYFHRRVFQILRHHKLIGVIFALPRRCLLYLL
uniref:redoxin domain-containing protein n=1 Tax=Candidatus Sodalis sp. SoCistrobi TaxID=1922216 RepID=UPI000A4BB2F5